MDGWIFQSFKFLKTESFSYILPIYISMCYITKGGQLLHCWRRLCHDSLKSHCDLQGAALSSLVSLM